MRKKFYVIFPAKRITVNLSPADLPKSGSRFDLPIAIGILAASGQMPADKLDEFEFIGELALDGQLRSVPGVLPSVVAMSNSGKMGFVPSANMAEAALAGDACCHTADHLIRVCEHLAGQQELALCVSNVETTHVPEYPDLSDVKGQQQAKRALEIAAAGGDNLLFIGPPGTGKSMLASRLPGIMPPLSVEEALESLAIYSVAKGEVDIEQWQRRPFRSPHHSASSAALVGGGCGFHKKMKHSIN